MNASFPLPNFSVDLRGQVALVTGASSGLGRRFAETLSSAGAAVILAARRVDRLQSLEKEICARGGKAVAIELDVSDPESIKAGVQQAEEALGLITILINNAAMMNNDRAIDLSLQAVNDLIDTNIRGPFLLSTEIARRLISANARGKIVNLSSVAAYKFPAEATMSLYGATKSGVLRLTEMLAVEWAPHGINVNGIAPGLFRTEMSESFIGDSEQVVVQPFPRKRVGEPAQLDSTLLYLVSPASDFVTGICLLIDDAQYSR